MHPQTKSWLLLCSAVAEVLVLEAAVQSTDVDGLTTSKDRPRAA